MAFPVTPLQQVEIDNYRAFLLGLQGAGIILPTPIPTSASTTTPPVLFNDQVGIASTTDNTTLAGVSTTTLGIMSRFTANVLSAGDKVADWIVGLFGSICSLINWLLLLIIAIISYLWYREWDQNRKIEIVNKEIDLK